MLKVLLQKSKNFYKSKKVSGKKDDVIRQYLIRNENINSTLLSLKLSGIKASLIKSSSLRLSNVSKLKVVSLDRMKFNSDMINTANNKHSVLFKEMNSSRCT